MLRMLIKPTTFTITSMQDKQNPYIDTHHVVNKKKVLQCHAQLEHAYQNTITYTIDHLQHILPDIVFTANTGLALPRLPEITILLPSMKYAQRQEELPYLLKIYHDLGIKTIPFPQHADAPFEGQAELKWFDGGKKAIGGYGHRSTKKSFDILKKVLHEIYTTHGLLPPTILAVPLASFDYYHLDVAMLEYDDSKCIVHKRAFSGKSIKKIKQFLGEDNVHVLDTTDSFCLNAVVDGNNLIIHPLHPSLKKEIEGITGKTVKMIDTSEFEKSGGSVRCMTLDVYK